MAKKIEIKAPKTVPRINTQSEWKAFFKLLAKLPDYPSISIDAWLPIFTEENGGSITKKDSQYTKIMNRLSYAREKLAKKAAAAGKKKATKKALSMTPKSSCSVCLDASKRPQQDQLSMFKLEQGRSSINQQLKEALAAKSRLIQQHDDKISQLEGKHEQEMIHLRMQRDQLTEQLQKADANLKNATNILSRQHSESSDFLNIHGQDWTANKTEFISKYSIGKKRNTKLQIKSILNQYVKNLKEQNPNKQNIKSYISGKQWRRSTMKKHGENITKFVNYFMDGELKYDNPLGGVDKKTTPQMSKKHMNTLKKFLQDEVKRNKMGSIELQKNLGEWCEHHLRFVRINLAFVVLSFILATGARPVEGAWILQQPKSAIIPQKYKFWEKQYPFIAVMPYHLTKTHKTEQDYEWFLTMDDKWMVDAMHKCGKPMETWTQMRSHIEYWFNQTLKKAGNIQATNKDEKYCMRSIRRFRASEYVRHLTEALCKNERVAGNPLQHTSSSQTLIKKYAKKNASNQNEALNRIIKNGEGAFISQQAASSFPHKQGE